MSKLTLDEAIEHAREVAKEQKKDNEQCKYKSEYGCKGCVDYYAKPCVECAEENEQLAEWLEELKALRHDANEWRKAGYAHGYSVGYNKAIDECYIKAKTLIDEMSYQCGRINGRTHRMYYIQALEFLRQVAKELKAGVENE